MQHNRIRTKLQQNSLALILLATSACVGAKPVVAPLQSVTPLSIRTMPSAMVPMLPMRITCQLPTDVGEGTYHFGISGMFMDQGPIDRLQFTTVINGQCEPIRIVCGYTPEGSDKEVMIYQDMQPTSECGRGH